MPSAAYDAARQQWLLRYRPPGATRARQVRARSEWRVRSHEQALALAERLDRASRILDGTAEDEFASPAAAARVLEQHGQLPPGWTSAGTPPGRARAASLSLAELLRAHPATRRESVQPEAQDARYARHLEEFCAWSGVRDARHVTADIVEDWIAARRRAGDAYYTRRHRLAALKRALAMAERRGLRNPLAGAQLDRQERRAPVAAMGLEDLGRLLRHLAEADDARMMTAVGLMGTMGLRPSEAGRARVRDLDGDLLSVGAEEAKNRASVRVLPVPPALLPWIERQREGRRPEAWLVDSRHRARRGCRMDRQAFMRLFRRRCEAAGVADHPPKTLRKTFFTASVRTHRLDRMQVEAYMGHATTGIAAVSADHYLAGGDPEYLRPVASAWSDWLRSVTPDAVPCYRQAQTTDSG